MARSLLLSTALLALEASAQMVGAPYTDDKTGIKFNGLSHKTGVKIGFALPEETKTDFVAQILAPITNDGGWAGLTMGQSMIDTLHAVAWPHDGKVISSFRKASGYTNPPVAKGDWKMTAIPEGTWVNETAFSYTFLCSNCIADGGLEIGDKNFFGWAYSKNALTSPTAAGGVLNMHGGGFGAFAMSMDDAKTADYAKYAAMAKESGAGDDASDPTTPGADEGGAAPPKNITATISNSTYDYIVCGAGPAGIIAAEKMAESGASVLLLERGGPSLAFTGNKDTLPWNSSVTMYDVPGLDYYLSKVGKNALCTDTADQAGCLLGGGSMVNAMMYVKPQARDFDDKWPVGWKWDDVSEAADRLYKRQPGQNYGSEDGVRYNDEAYGVLSKFLGANGWKETDLIDGDINARKDVYGHPPWLLADGMRSGPVRTYLPEAQKLSNFELMLNTKVVRAVRKGSAINGVETETDAGARVIYNLKAGGKVILAAGALSTPRILINSGIGPAEQIKTVKTGSAAVTLPEESEWIDLPVGAEIKDHVIFTLKFKTSEPMSSPPTSDITSPNQTVIDQFAKGSGLLSQSGQRLNFWTSVKTSNGTEMFIQGTCNGPANDTVQMKVYLTHGLTSVGSIGMTAEGATELTKQPWLQTDDDIEAITTFMDRILEMTNAPNSTLKYISDGKNVTGADLIKTHVTGSHWVGSAKMGTKGEAGVVVDSDTKVYGTDNLFVVDASFHPDLPTGNTQAIVMVAAEAAAARIIGLKTGAGNGTVIPPPSDNAAPAKPTKSAVAIVPIPSSTAVSPTAAAASPSAIAASSSAVPVASTSVAAPVSSSASSASASAPAAATPSGGAPVALYGRCGGIGYEGVTACEAGSSCVKMNDWYSQCVKP